jgi:hypothetical protein
MITTLSALAAEFKKLSSGLDVEDYYKTFHTTPQHDGSPHIELGDGGFEFVVTERGTEFERIKGLSADDILYLLLEGATMEMATEYELKNRKPGIDGRSVWFPYQEQLMASLKPAWGERLALEHKKVLNKHPIFHG